MVRTVDAGLLAHGLELVESGGDFAVGYQVTTRERNTNGTVGVGWGDYDWMWRSWHPRLGGMPAATPRAGMLILALFDGKSKELVWPVTAANTIRAEQSPQERGIASARWSPRCSSTFHSGVDRQPSRFNRAREKGVAPTVTFSNPNRRSICCDWGVWRECL